MAQSPQYVLHGGSHNVDTACCFEREREREREREGGGGEGARAVIHTTKLLPPEWRMQGGSVGINFQSDNGLGLTFRLLIELTSHEYY